jgi:hypothetical protein
LNHRIDEQNKYEYLTKFKDGEEEWIKVENFDGLGAIKKYWKSFESKKNKKSDRKIINKNKIGVNKKKKKN